MKNLSFSRRELLAVVVLACTLLCPEIYAQDAAAGVAAVTAVTTDVAKYIPVLPTSHRQ